MNPVEEITRLLISRAIRRSKKGWATVAAELSAAVASNITESMLHEFTRARRFSPFEPNSKGTKKLFPADWILPLARITASHELEAFALCDDCRRALAVGKIGLDQMAGKR